MTNALFLGCFWLSILLIGAFFFRAGMNVRKFGMENALDHCWGEDWYES